MYDTHLGIGVVKTDSQISLQAHRVKKVAFAPARVAFIGLMRINIWGIASLLKKTAFEVDKATTDSQSAPNYWWDVQARWRNAWWNLGGDWNKFVSAVNKGAGRKAIGIDLAPRKIKDKLKSKGIGSVGIGAVDPATLTAAAAIIAALTPLILSTINLVKGKKQETPTAFEFTPVKTDSETDLDFGLTDEEGNITTAGYGLIGVGVLGLLLLGTKKKGKKLF
jgi:hypothetical protein